METDALWVTLRLASATTLLLVAIAIPLARWIAFAPRPVYSTTRALVQAAVALPLVLPPTVIGFYLLVGFGPLHWTGRALTQILGHPLAFSFAGLLVGSVIYSLPFAVQPLVAGFQAIEPGYLEAAEGLGTKPGKVFFGLVLPMARNSILTAAILTFTHTIGEFGVVLMLGGDLPGSTRTLSIALYDQVQDSRYGAASATALLLVGVSLAALMLIYLRPRFGRTPPHRRSAPHG